MFKKKAWKNIAVFLLTFLLAASQVVGLLPGFVPIAGATQPDLVITGTGLYNEVVIFAGDWSKYNKTERYYSSNNSFNFHKITRVSGYDLFELIGEGNLKTDKDYPVTFEASDGFKVTMSMSELRAHFTYPDFTLEGKKPINPMVGFERVEIVSILNTDLKPPVTWEDKPLESDANAPRIYFGQKDGNISDMNQSNWVRDLVKIQVGDPRPAEAPAPAVDGSPYKHITYEGEPYNVDAITGATFTIEGPGVESYRAISLRQLEEEDAAIVRGTYAETVDGRVVENTYEGIPVSYLLDNYVELRKNAGKIVFKDKARRTIAEFSLADVRKTDYINSVSGAKNLQMIVAYGVNEVPLVYNKANAGYVPEKMNDEGCFKLVYGQKSASDPAPELFNVAYIYVEEADAKGIYEHSYAPYNDPKYTNYIFTLTGSGLGKEVNYTVADLEAMTDMIIEMDYSLSNSYYYWYYHTFKGVPLWDLLLAAGLDPNIDENTPVYLEAADFYNVPPLTIKHLKDPDMYGYYEKDPRDLGDGTFDGTSVKPLKTGYPVMVSYGYNGYPYVMHPSDPGYNSGLGNDGGPLRIVFGKLDYNHTNGSHQLKFAKRVIIGEDVKYATHTYQPYNAFAQSPLTVTVIADDGSTLKTENLTVQGIEDMVYKVPAAEAQKAQVKDYFFTKVYNDDKISDLYEGVGLNYLLFEKIGLPGTMGTVTFENAGGDKLTVRLEDMLQGEYFNEVTGSYNVKPVLAYAKNGYPMVESRDNEGYVGGAIVNRDGPLAVLFGQTETGKPGQMLTNVQKITVNIMKDSWAHMEPPYDQYAGQELVIRGNGVRKEVKIPLSELETRQNYIFTADYCLIRRSGQKLLDEYRGIDIYEFLRREVGFAAGAQQVTFVAADGFSRTFPIEEIAKRDYINEETGRDNLRVMLAYGKNGVPLVSGEDSPGYDESTENSGGPLRLVVGQTEPGDVNSSKSVSSVVEIVVEAGEVDSWKHDYGVYTQYLDQPVLRVTGSQVKAPRSFTLRELEALDEHIIRALYMGEQEAEGVILWNLIKDVVGLKSGVSEPSSIRVFAGPNYNQLQTVNQVINGVENSQGEIKDIILAYAMDGYPLVPNASSPGYEHNNEFGPVRLIVEENISMWTKWVDCIVVGAGGYESPETDGTAPVSETPGESEAVVDATKSFTVFDDAMKVQRSFDVAGLKAFGEKTVKYSYTVGGQLITDECTGVLLADVLKALGVTGADTKIRVVATDGFDAGEITLQEVIDQEYLVTYLVNGASFEDTKEGFDSSAIRIYRNFNDGSNWRNRLTLVAGISVEGLALEELPRTSAWPLKGYELAVLLALMLCAGGLLLGKSRRGQSM